MLWTYSYLDRVFVVVLRRLYINWQHDEENEEASICQLHSNDTWREHRHGSSARFRPQISALPELGSSMPA
jgi:hypothetical protein